MATAKQLATYVQVCQRKGVSPLNLNSMNNQDASAELQRVFKLPNLAQLEALRTALQEVIDMGVEVNGKPVQMPPATWFAKLNEDDVSDWIKRTYNLKNNNLHIAAPSKEQMEKLLNMYLFPDIPWEAIPVTRKEEVDAWNDEGYTERRVITMQETVNLSQELIWNEDGTPYMVVDKNTGHTRQGFRLRTREEFEKAILDNLKHSDASYIIKEYEGEFIRWERERISDSQIKMIQKLEMDLSTVYNPQGAEEESTTDVPFGDADMPFQVVPAKQSKRGQRWNPQSYNPTKLEVLKCFDRQQANKYIQSLTAERDNAEIIKFAEGQYALQITNRKDFEGVERTYRSQIVKSEWRNNRGYVEFMDDTTLEAVRTAQDHKAWKESEFEKLNNVLFSLQAVAGFSIDEFLGEAAQVFFGNGKGEDGTEMNVPALEHRALKLRGKIRKVMIKCIKDGNITFHGLMTMIEKSELAQEIFLAIE